MWYIDWIILIFYILGIVLLSYFIGKKQEKQAEYYLGEKNISSWKVGLSLMANQVSAISLVGVPAFVAIKKGGGLKWLQYEIAVPLAMIAIVILYLPMYMKTKGFTIYSFVEEKLGKRMKNILSIVFIISRLLAGSISLLATSYVTAVCLNISLEMTIFLVGVVALFYVSFGGIKADIYSDIIQLIILWGSSFLMIFVFIFKFNISISPTSIESLRFKILDFSGTGFFDEKTFSFLPMLFGGFFLYVSYYGCDQTQAQRLLSMKGEKEIKNALLINGILRFLLVLTYSMVGLFLIFFLKDFPEFSKVASLNSPDFIVPLFVKYYLPHGAIGIVVAGIFSATMSSLDSTINSLSAVLYEDFLLKLKIVNELNEKKRLQLSRVLTFVFGLVLIFCSYLFINASETVVELVNKIGSAFYGPIAGVFFIAVFNGKPLKKLELFFLTGVMVNIFFWIFLERSVSWLWWNVIGFIITIIPFWNKIGDLSKNLYLSYKKNKVYAFLLGSWFILILLTLFGVEKLLSK